MSDVKRCVQCGILKAEDAFRKYTYSVKAGTAGRYRVCKECESLNSRYSTLSKNASSAEQKYELECIEELYLLLASKGLRVPTIKRISKQNTLDKLMQFYDTGANRPKANATASPISEEIVGIPEELASWLSAPQSDWIENKLSPEYLQETVYESLKNKYRPQTGVDKDKYIPIYDDTYKSVLNSILKRFDDYEEAYANSEEGEKDE